MLKKTGKIGLLILIMGLITIQLPLLGYAEAIQGPDYEMQVLITKDTDVMYGGNPTVDVSLSVRTANGASLIGKQSLTLVYDQAILQLLNTEATIDVHSAHGAANPLALTSNIAAGHVVAPDEVIAELYYAYNDDEILGCIYLQPVFDYTGSTQSYTDFTNISQVKFGFVAGKGPSDVTNTTIHFVSEADPFIEDKVAMLTAGDTNNYFYGAWSGAGLTADTIPDVEIVGFLATLPEITTDLPETDTAVQTREKTLTVAANGDSISYQWYSNDEATTVTPTLLDGETEATYTFRPTTIGTEYYFCKMTNTDDTCINSENSLESRVVTLTVEEPDETAPVLSDGEVTVIGSTSATIEFTADEAGKFDVLVVNNDDAVPTVADFNNPLTRDMIAGVNCFDVSGLAISTPYDVYILAEDDEPAGYINTMTDPFKVDIHTIKATLGGRVAISGDAAYGNALTVNITDLENNVDQSSLHYQWFLDGGAIPSAIGTIYHSNSSQIGHAVTVGVVSDDEYGTMISNEIIIEKTAGAAAPVDPAPIDVETTHNRITLQSITNGEYSLNGLVWQTSTLFEGLDPGVEYTFYQRTVETETQSASQASHALIATHDLVTCDIAKTDRGATTDDGSITIFPYGGSGNYEYSIDGGSNWVNTPVFTDLAVGEYLVMVQDSLHSSNQSAIADVLIVNEGEITVTFDLNYLGGGSFQTTTDAQGNVAEPDDPVRNHYAFDHWYQEPSCLNLFDFSQTISSQTTAYAGWHLDTLSRYATVEGTNQFDETLTVRRILPYEATGTMTYEWIRLDGSDTVVGSAASYHTQLADVGYNLKVVVSFSDLNGQYIETIPFSKKANTNMPPAPIVAAVTRNSIVLVNYNGYEYSLDGQTWVDGFNFTGLARGTEYSFYQRVGETDTHLASPTSEVVDITTNDKVSITASQTAAYGAGAENATITVVANGAEVYEYQRDDGDWQLSDTFSGLGSGTYHVRARDLNEITNISPDIVIEIEERTDCEVTFDLNYVGSTNFDVMVNLGDPVSRPTDPIRLGYDFDDWYQTVACQDLYNFNTIINLPRTIFANWTIADLAGSISINGNVQYGQTITADISNITNNTGVLSYEWFVNGQTVGTNASYQPVAADIGQNLTLTVKSSVQTGEVTSASSLIAKADGPVAPSSPSLVTKTTSSVTLSAHNGYEYSINSGQAWQTSAVFSNLRSGTGYIFVQRIAETATHLASATSGTLSVTTTSTSSGGGGGGWFPPIVTPPMIDFPPFVEPEPIVTQDIVVLTIGEIMASMNGESSELDAGPFIDSESGRTLVPIRFISEMLGARVNWLAETRQVEIIDGDQVILLTIDSPIVLVNGLEQEIDIAARIVSARTFVPLRFVAEVLGAQVNYDGATKTITIIKETITIPEYVPPVTQ